MILLTYGQPKSASTYLAELARRACALGGSDQNSLLAQHGADLPQLTGKFWSGSLAGIGELAARLDPGDRLGIKTHSPPPPNLTELLADADLRVLISYRHPGDAALSMFEAGAKARAEGDDRQPDFASLMSHREAIGAALDHVDNFLLPWLRTGAGTALSFDTLVQAPEQVLQIVAEAADVPLGALEADRTVRNLVSGRKRVYNFNRGESGRFRTAFAPEDIAYLTDHAGRFIAFCEGRIGRDAL